MPSTDPSLQTPITLVVIEQVQNPVRTQLPFSLFFQHPVRSISVVLARILDTKTLISMSFSKMKNLNPQSLQSCLNRRSLRTRFAIRFLESLRKLSARKCIRRRSQMIKLTADASMASVVGPQRAWSRATLLQIRWRTRRTRTRSLLGRRKKNYSGGHRTQEEKLRELVPGGKAMDASILLEETAHYIKCLTHQVFVMRSIVDYCSI